MSRTALGAVLFAIILLSGPAAGQAPSEEEAPSHAPRLVLKGFGDFNFRLVHNNDSGSTNDTFTLGQVDLFITSELGERVSVLSEVVGKFNSQTNVTTFDVERIHITYSFSDLLNVRVGRMHTALGYWNQTYHHGAWFQTTAQRPVIYLFNDVGGVLPIHAIGVEVFGTKAFQPVDVSWNVGVMNGRGRTVTETENVNDFNKLKAVNVLLGFTPNVLPGLKIGGDVYIDKIPTTTGRNDQLDETLFGGYAVYVLGPVEFLSEYFNIYHRDDPVGSSWRSQALYIQGAFQIGKIKPYARLDYQDLAKGDPYFLPAQLRTRLTTVGLRWDPLTWDGIKLEYSFGNRDGLEEQGVTLQTAFTF